MTSLHQASDKQAPSHTSVYLCQTVHVLVPRWERIVTWEEFVGNIVGINSFRILCGTEGEGTVHQPMKVWERELGMSCTGTVQETPAAGIT